MDFDIRGFKFEVAKLSDIDFIPVSASHECVPYQLRMRAVPGGGYPLDGVVSPVGCQVSLFHFSAVVDVAGFGAGEIVRPVVASWFWSCPTVCAQAA